METLGRLKTIVASIEGPHGLPLDDVPETLQWCIGQIERLTKERDDLSKRLDRMHRPRCDGYCDDPEGPWPILQNPCQFCGARQETDACRDMADTADCDRIRKELDKTNDELKFLRKRDEQQSDMIRQINPLWR